MSVTNGQPLCLVPSEEARIVALAAYALHYNEARGDAVWLCVQRERRVWVVETASGRFEHVVADSHPDCRCTDRWLPLSVRTIDFVVATGDEAVALQLVDNTVLAVAEHVSAAIDLIDTDNWPEGPHLHTLDIDAGALLTAQRINSLLAVARLLPAGVNTRDTIMPPMWLQFTEGTGMPDEHGAQQGELGVFVDWSAAFDSRSTFRADTIHSYGNGMVPIWPAAFGSLVEELPADSMITLQVSPPSLHTPRYLVVGGDDWRFAVPAPDPLVARWSTTIEDLVKAADECSVHLREGHEWVLGVDDSLVRVSLHAGNPDTARVSAVVVEQADQTTELLLELNQLNMASTSLRYCFADGAVRVITDLPCTNLDRLVASAREAVAAVRQYMDVLRPLAVVGAAGAAD